MDDGKTGSALQVDQTKLRCGKSGPRNGVGGGGLGSNPRHDPQSHPEIFHRFTQTIDIKTTTITSSLFPGVFNNSSEII